MLELCLKGEEVFAPSAGAILPPCLLTVGGRHIWEMQVAQCGQSRVSGQPAESDEQEADHTDTTWEVLGMLPEVCGATGGT